MGHDVGRRRARRPRRVRRAVACAVAGTLLAGTALVVTAPSAAAHDSIDHFCGGLRLPDDNGPVTDVIHHGVEVPLGFLDSSLDGPGWFLLHSTNCQVSGLEWNLLETLGLPPR